MRAQHGEMHRRFEPKSLWGYHIQFATKAFSKLSPGHQRQYLKSVTFGRNYGMGAIFVETFSRPTVESSHGH